MKSILPQSSPHTPVSIVIVKKLMTNIGEHWENGTLTNHYNEYNTVFVIYKSVFRVRKQVNIDLF